MSRSLVAITLLTIAALGGPAARGGSPATGPLRRSDVNPRYFVNASGKAILLTGSHNWHNFQDNGHRHPVGMSYMHQGGTNRMLVDSPADWISPNQGAPEDDYKNKPPARDVGKVVVNDTDHLWGHQGGDGVWVWKSFTRGLNVLFMEELLPSPTWQDSARVAMGQVARYAARLDLARMFPTPELAQTGYVLAAPGREYLAFQDGSQGEFSINLKGAPGTFEVEWLDVTRGVALPGTAIVGGGRRTFTTPFPGPAAVYLKQAGAR